MTNPSEIYEYYVVIPHGTQPAVLMLHTENGWSLPFWKTTKRHFWQTCDHINQTVRDLLALRVGTLRCLLADRDPENRHLVRVYELENRDVLLPPPVSGSWIGFSEFKTLPLTHPAQRTMLEAWFLEQMEGVPAQRRPWARVGWFDETARWVIETLRSQDILVNDEVKQIRTWERSCLLQVSTTLGPVYCKAVPAMFSHELPLTHYLDTHYPLYAPRVLAVNSERGLLLLRDFGGPQLSEQGVFAWWEEAVRTFASLQQETAARTGTLVTIGCPSRILEDLANDIRTLLADTEALFVGGKGLTSTEVVALRTRLPYFVSLCQELMTYQLPYTLEHGDFGPTNVAWVEQRPLFFDWSDSSITHPFFSLGFFADEIETTFPDISDWQMRQRSAYLQPWMRYESLERLTRAFEIAQCLAPLHHASRYHRFILPHMEAKWEMALMIPAYLRCLLPMTGIEGDFP